MSEYIVQHGVNKRIENERVWIFKCLYTLVLAAENGPQDEITPSLQSHMASCKSSPFPNTLKLDDKIHLNNQNLNNSGEVSAFCIPSKSLSMEEIYSGIIITNKGKKKSQIEKTTGNL